MDRSTTRWGALEHLALWMVFKGHWADHSVSVTINVREHEWLDVATWVYKNFDKVTGISFLPFSDHTYAQALYQPITADEYHAAVATFPEIQWADLAFYETGDTTAGSRDLACSADGLGCEVVDITS